MSSYAPLTHHLQAHATDLMRLSFGEIEAILGRKLPRSAATSRAFWSNNGANNVMTRAWLEAGYVTEKVDLPGKTLVFRRTKKEHTVPGLEEAQVPFAADEPGELSLPPLFGWQKGTITIAPGVDLTEPADPELGAYLERKYGSDDPFA